MNQNHHTISSPSDTVKLLEGHTDTIWSFCVVPDVSPNDHSGPLLRKNSDAAETPKNGNEPASSRANWGEKLWSASGDGRIRVWDLNRMECIHTIQAHIGTVWSILLVERSVNAAECVSESSGPHAFQHGSGDLVFSAGQDHFVQAWDSRILPRESDGSDSVGTFKGHAGSVYCLASDQTSHRLFSGSWDKKIMVWDDRQISNGKEKDGLGLLNTLTGHTGVVRSLCVHRPTNRLFSGFGWGDKALKVWSLDELVIERSLGGFEGKVYSILADSQSNRLYIGSQNPTVKVLDLLTLSVVGSLRGHTDYVRSLSKCPGGILSGSEDKSMKLWDDSLHLKKTFTASQAVHTACAIPNSDETLFVAGCWDDTIRIWN